MKKICRCHLKQLFNKMKPLFFCYSRHKRHTSTRISKLGDKSKLGVFDFSVKRRHRVPQKICSVTRKFFGQFSLHDPCFSGSIWQERFGIASNMKPANQEGTNGKYTIWDVLFRSHRVLCDTAILK